MTKHTHADVSRELAVRLIGGLRQGSNSLEGVSLFSAGREPVLRAAETLMDELSMSGGSAVRWLKGVYGSGKTNTFARLLEAAHSRRWLVTHVQVSGKGMGCELHRFEEIYASVIRNCVSPAQVHATQALTSPGTDNGWQWLLDDWVESLKRQIGAGAGADVPSMRFRETVDGTISQLQLLRGIHGSFAAALRGYALASIDHDLERREILLDWFAGTDVLKISPAIKASLRAAHILEPVSRRNAKAMLRQLTAFARYRGYRGFLILIDEVENVLQLSVSQRRMAYTLLRELIDNIDERHGMAQTLLFLSGTPDLFEGEKGIAEHEALAGRVLLPSSNSPPNPAAPVVDLTAFPITAADFLTIGMNIASLYYVAGGAPKHVSKPTQDALTALLPLNPLPSPRAWVRTVVDLLDRQSA